MFGSGEAFDDRAAAFAQQVVALYTRNLGACAAPLIGLAAGTVMFSTTLTVADGFPRAGRVERLGRGLEGAAFFRRDRLDRRHRAPEVRHRPLLPRAVARGPVDPRASQNLHRDGQL